MKNIAVAALLLLAAVAANASSLPFVEDDYARALARAKSENLPIFVEAWAPW